MPGHPHWRRPAITKDVQEHKPILFEAAETARAAVERPDKPGAQSVPSRLGPHCCYLRVILFSASLRRMGADLKNSPHTRAKSSHETRHGGILESL